MSSPGSLAAWIEQDSTTLPSNSIDHSDSMRVIREFLTFKDKAYMNGAFQGC
jgi:hypothetical protein